MTNVTESTMAAGAAPSMVPGFGNASLYVGDLDGNVNEERLFEQFHRVAPVVTVRVCRDVVTNRSLGYGYVNFTSPQDAAHAMNALNFTPINGKPMRIMFCQRDPSLRKSGYANVFIKNLDLSIDNRALFETFSAYGTILSCKVAVNSATGQSKGYGFVQFDKEEAAQAAIKSLNGMLLNDKKVFVGLFVRRQVRNECPKFTNVYVKNLSERLTDGELKGLFGEFGEITSCVVMKDGEGKSKGFGFVNFGSPQSAKVAIERLNGKVYDEKVWYVGRAQKKAEREAELKARFEQERISRYQKLQGANLYMKNLDDSINDEKLKEMFSKFGTITSCKIMRDPKGASKGSGFVSFATPEEAAKALAEMNAKMVEGKPLYVAVAQRKEERKARIQAGFAQLQAQANVAQGFHPGAPQQVYFGAGRPALMAPRPPAGYGFHQPQVYTGVRPGIGVASNYMMPFLPRQGPHSQRRHGGFGQKPSHQLPMANTVANQGLRSTANTRTDSGVAAVSQGLAKDLVHQPLSSVLMSALHTASLDEQRTILGEHLYPLVEVIDSENAGKVTGMLLEMDQPEVLHLIESPEALKEKVAEAVHVLRQVASPRAAETATASN